MKDIGKNILTIAVIIAATAITIYFLPLIPNFLRQTETKDIIGLQPGLTVLIFLIFNVIAIGIPAWIHRTYVNDYSKVKNIWFFALFGGIIFGLLGEGGNPIMILPYTILMLVYAYFYKKFIWWKVALTTYLAGIIIENVINRSPIHISTLIWIAFFTAPYFVTKIFENRKEIKLLEILIDLKWTFSASIILSAFAVYISRNNSSPPLILFGLALPFLITILYRIIKKRE